MRGTQRRSRKRHAGHRAKATLTDCMNGNQLNTGRSWVAHGATVEAENNSLSRFHARLQPGVFALDADYEFDFVRTLLFLEIVGLFTDELLKRFEGQLGDIFSSLFLRMAKGCVEILHFFLFVVGIFAGNRKWPMFRRLGRGFGGLLLLS